MNNKLKASLIGIPLFIGMILLSQWYIDINKNASEEFRYLIYAIGTGIIALGLHFAKDIPAIKKIPDVLISFNSMELLLLVMTPILSIFQIFIKENPAEMIILITAGILSWWFVIVIKTDNASGKMALRLSAQLYAGLLAIVAISAWILALH